MKPGRHITQPIPEMSMWPEEVKANMLAFSNPVFVLAAAIHALNDWALTLDPVPFIDANLVHEMGGPTFAHLTIGGYQFRVTVEPDDA